MWSAVKGRESYDNKGIREAAEKAGVDVEAFSTVGEPTDRLQVFPVSGKSPLSNRIGEAKKGKREREHG